MTDYTEEQWAALWEMVAAVDLFCDNDPTAKRAADPSERVRLVCINWGTVLREPWRAWRAAMGEPVSDDGTPVLVGNAYAELERELAARDEALAEAIEECVQLAAELDLARRENA